MRVKVQMNGESVRFIDCVYCCWRDMKHLGASHPIYNGGILIVDALGHRYLIFCDAESFLSKTKCLLTEGWADLSEIGVCEERFW